MSKYEDFINYIDKDNDNDNIFKSKDELLKYNNSLKENNILLRRIIENLLRKNHEKINDEEMKKINNIINLEKSFSTFNEDLIMFLKNQDNLIRNTLDNYS